MNIAVLGTGIMGAPMARHLAQGGHCVAVHNRSLEKAAGLAAEGARVARDPADAVRGAEVVVTMVTDGEAAESVMAAAAAGGFADGAVWWQAATVGLSATERLSAIAAAHGLAFVDGPVLGTRGPAEDGALVVLAAGEHHAVQRCLPLFDAVGSRTIRLGAEPGAATRMKLVLNHWVLAITDGLAETIGFAQGLGLDPAVFLDVIDGGPLDISYAHLKAPGMIAGALPVTFPLKHALKDATLILDAARRRDVHLTLAPAMRERFARAAAAGHGDEDVGLVNAVAAR